MLPRGLVGRRNDREANDSLNAHGALGGQARGRHDARDIARRDDIHLR